MQSGLKEQKIRRLFRIGCNIAVVVVLAAGMILPRLRVRSSDTGREQAAILKRLGILSKSDPAFLGRTLTRGTAEETVLKLLGCGDAAQAADFYHYVKLQEVPVFHAADADAALRDVDGYRFLLETLGYPEKQIGAADADALKTAEDAGFGFLIAVRNGSLPLTNGKFTVMLYEMLFLRPNGTGFPVYRILANLNSDFAARLKQNGLLDEIPEDLVPLFNDGIYRKDSFAVLPGAADSCEWVCTYDRVSDSYLAQYLELLQKNGWNSEGTYAFEGERTAEAQVLWKPDGTGELGLVLKYYSDAVLDWALFSD